MKLHSQDRNHEKVFDILKEYPDYIAMKEELQVYRNKERQLESRIKEIEANAVKRFMESAEIVEETSTYKIIKVYSPQKNESNPMVE